MGWLMMPVWSPYIVGAGIGVLACLCVVLLKNTLGCSTAYARTSGLIERHFRGARVMQRAFYQETNPEIDWQWMLIVGIVIGSFLSSVMSGQFRFEAVPGRWAVHFGDAVWLRLLVAFVGGTMLGIGARWARGCTSGHGISGTMQLAVSSWLATAAFFVGGIATALILYRLM